MGWFFRSLPEIRKEIGKEIGPRAHTSPNAEDEISAQDPNALARDQLPSARATA
jgi:hypothetical protein